MRCPGKVVQPRQRKDQLWDDCEIRRRLSRVSEVHLRVCQERREDRMASGDVVISGTDPGTAVERGRDGNKWLRPGDRVEVEVEGGGILRNDIAEW